MARLNNVSRPGVSKQIVYEHDRRGTVSIVTLFAILGLLILIGFVGNAGHAVNRKIESQNASDAAAISGAQWMARGMNNVTATNHLLGEVTAIATIHEALGGPEVDAEIEASTAESGIYNSTIRSLQSFAPINGLPTYVPANLRAMDIDFIDFVVKEMAPEDEEKFRTFATIYDSKMTLKKDLARQLIYKGVANLGLFVPPPWGYASAALAYGVHLRGTATIGEIAIEWYTLTALEEVAIQIKGLKKDMIEARLIPALAAHSESVAARNQADESNEITDTIQGSLVGNSIQHALNRVQDHSSFEVNTFPRPFVIKLPVEFEPEPSMQPGASQPEWDGNRDVDDDALDLDMQQIRGEHLDKKRKINRRIRRLEREIRILDEQEDVVTELLEPTTGGPNEQELETELEEIRMLRDGREPDLEYSKKSKLDQTRRELADMEREFQNLLDNVGLYQAMQSQGGGNLSERHLPNDFLNQQQERNTQWVRATYPYVDALRAPIISMFASHLNRSKAKQHFIKWTNRYTLVKSWQFRSGYRFEKTGTESGKWSKPDDFKPLNMFVMKDTFDRSDVSRKGQEPWTFSDADGKQAAEKLFTVIGLAHRSFDPLFSPAVYPTPNENALTTYSQAVIYNANSQTQLAANVQTGLTQTKIGWDTLNWAPETDTPEWGSPATEDSARWPWDVFSAASRIDSIKVKLNWQAKLMPTTKSRITEAAADNLANQVGKSLGLSLPGFETLSSH